MLDNLNLTHMNGRVYDQVVGRFLSADPFIDGVGNTQGWNRYSYVHNNPLSAVDPSGFSTDETARERRERRDAWFAENGGVSPAAEIPFMRGQELWQQTWGPMMNGGMSPAWSFSGMGWFQFTRMPGFRGPTGEVGAQGAAQWNYVHSGQVDVSDPNTGEPADQGSRYSQGYWERVYSTVGGPRSESQWVVISLGYTNTPVRMGTNHALVVATDPLTGESYATRAGPDTGKVEREGSGYGLGTIYAEYGVYDETFRDAPSNVHTIQHVGQLNMSLATVAGRMAEFANITNANNLPYTPRFNSNSYAFTFIESLGFNRPRPINWAPGWRSGRPSYDLSY